MNWFIMNQTYQLFKSKDYLGWSYFQEWIIMDDGKREERDHLRWTDLPLMNQIFQHFVWV